MSDNDRRKEKALKDRTKAALRKLTVADLEKEVYGTDRVKEENKKARKPGHKQ